MTKSVKLSVTLHVLYYSHPLAGLPILPGLLYDDELEIWEKDKGNCLILELDPEIEATE